MLFCTNKLRGLLEDRNRLQKFLRKNGEIAQNQENEIKYISTVRKESQLHTK